MEEQQIDDLDTVSYVDEIASMMHGFGDSPTPNTETVRLVESVIRKQLREMLCEILSKHPEKSAKLITAEDIVFYLRFNKHKIQRLVKYVHFKYIDKKVSNMDGATDYMEKKKNKTLYDNVKKFVDFIDETGEYSDTNLFDAVKHSRNMRAAKLSLSMDDERYLEYAKARCVSFNHAKWSTIRNIKRFNKWIDPQSDFMLHNSATELMSFIAYGIVANVTDMALIIRENNCYSASDPLKMKVGHYHNSTMFSVPHVTNNYMSNYSNPNRSFVNKGQPPINTHEVYEVLRRIYMPSVGYMKFSYKSVYGKRKLCY